MKSLLRFSFLLVLFISCSEDPNFNTNHSHDTGTNPLIDLNSDSHSTKSLNELDNIYIVPYPFDSLSYQPIFDSIFIPIGLPREVSSQLIKTKVIDGSVGGKIHISFRKLIDEKSVSVEAILTIPPDAFAGTKRIWMVLSNDIGTVWFYPHMIFNIPVRYDVKSQGLNSLNVTPSTVDFVYQHYNGSIELVNYVSLDVLTDEGTLTLVAAQLNHFSRYGWTR